MKTIPALPVLVIMAASASASGTKASSSSSPLSSSSLLRGSSSTPARSVANDAARSTPPSGLTSRGVQVVDQMCVVATGPHTYETVTCDYNFFATCNQNPVCAGSDQITAMQDGEASCGSKFTVWSNENTPACPWQYQCC
jgi:hypothetical protein